MDFENEIDSFLGTLTEMAKEIFGRGDMLIGVASKVNEKDMGLKNFVEKFPVIQKDQIMDIRVRKENTYIEIPAMISHTAEAINLNAVGEKISGA